MTENGANRAARWSPVIPALKHGTECSAGPFFTKAMRSEPGYMPEPILPSLVFEFMRHLGISVREYGQAREAVRLLEAAVAASPKLRPDLRPPAFIESFLGAINHFENCIKALDSSLRFALAINKESQSAWAAWMPPADAVKSVRDFRNRLQHHDEDLLAYKVVPHVFLVGDDSVQIWGQAGSPDMFMSIAYKDLASWIDALNEMGLVFAMNGCVVAPPAGSCPP